jgi:hypothetical protein
MSGDRSGDEIDRLRGEGDAARRFLSALAAGGDAVDHLDPDSELHPYVEGTLDRASRQKVEAHLAICELCREDVEDLRGVEVQRPARARWIAAAAAVAAAIALVVVATRWWTPEPVVAPRAIRVQTPVAAPAMSDPWHDLLRSAIASGRLEEPAVLATLRPRKEALRGSHAHDAVMRAPVGVVVESERPRFSWTPTHGATYRVSVFDGDRLVVQSPFLSADTWDSDRDLARGRVYSWQVEVRRGRERTVIPDPAEGDALFHVLDEGAARDISAARIRFADDHLLAGVLYAHYGLRDRAEEEMKLAAASPAQAADARRLADSIRQWQEWRR